MIAIPKSLQLLAFTPVAASRPLFVFLPGMDGSGELLQPQVAGLSTCFDIRCLSIPPVDLRGWEELTEHVAALIQMEQQRHPGRKTTVCGESFGGCLALRLITRFPKVCDQLILVNPATSAQRQPWIGACSALTQLLTKPIYQLSTFGLCNLLIASHRVSRPRRHQLLAAMQAVRPQSAAWRLALLRQFRLEDLPLDRVHQPVLSWPQKRIDSCPLNAKRSDWHAFFQTPQSFSFRIVGMSAFWRINSICLPSSSRRIFVVTS